MTYFEEISEEELARYEKYFFESVCKIDTKGRKSFDTPMLQTQGLRFACVQDTVERLTELEHGRLSRFQWRNFVFVPIDRTVIAEDLYDEVFDLLMKSYPSLFIRSYVYVVFISVYGSNSLVFGDFDGSKSEPVASDFTTYLWNTNYDIRRQYPSELSKIGAPASNTKDQIFPDGRNIEKVFLISNPKAELQRIQDANSDVIDAVKAFYGDLGLVKQTEEHLKMVESSLPKPGSRVLVEGPARSGKTIIAMSLLASNRNSKMLLMNWYFYDALKDAFRVWAHLDKNQIAALFETSQKTKNELDMRDIDEDLLRTREEHTNILIELSEMWSLQAEGDNFADGISQLEKVQDVYMATNPKKKKPGELILVERNDGVIQAKIVEKRLDGDPENLARTSFITHVDNQYKSIFTEWCRNRPISVEGARKRSEHLANLEKQARQSTVAEIAAEKLKTIADALDSTEQRFFHHDRRPEYRDHGGLQYFVKDRRVKEFPYGYWKYRVSDGCTLVCDEAQRLWDDEAKWIRDRPGSVFLCGDDNQRLNLRGDGGMGRVLNAPNLKKFELPDSIGIPAEIGVLVKSMLGEASVPNVPNNYNIKLIHADDLALVAEFNKDHSAKKHYAIPVSTGFLPKDYVPAIMKAAEPTEVCNDECVKNSDGYCLHRYIRMICPLSDPKQLQAKESRKDLSKGYKFFCAEAIMPNYALSAYELISREVESIYLKIPSTFDKRVLEAPLDGNQYVYSWIKRHLYVLMTRATANLIINVEDKLLYDYFRKVCREAGLNCDI